jgi:cyclophilin family peptidyl-prolyl cis-trans isomerase
MKRFLFTLVILVAVVGISACSLEKADPIETGNVPDVVNDGYSEAPAGLVPEAVSEEPAETITEIVPLDNQDNKINDKIMKNPSEQTDLTKQYSQAVLKTNYGDITVKFYNAEAPVTVNNFLNLAQAGFYDEVKFHRVIKNFMIQGGDPLSKEDNSAVWGTGGPGYQFADEFNAHKLVAGSLAMANAGPGTNGSQFFIVTAAETPWLDGKHTNFGQVTAGLDVVKKIEAVETGVNDRPLTAVVIKSITLQK